MESRNKGLCYDWWAKRFWLIILATYENIQRITNVQGHIYRTVLFTDYIYFRNYYKMISIDLSKQQALDLDPKAMKQINITWNLARDGDAVKIMSFIPEGEKETILDFSKGTVKVLWIHFALI